MPKSLRPLTLAVLILLSSIVLGVASAMTAAITLAATALIVPGTGTPNANVVPGYKENFRNYYMGFTPCATNCTDDDLVGINYPASFFPFGFPPFPSSWCPGLSCATWNESVGTGVSNLDSALTALLNSDDPEAQQIVIAGYSQGGGVVSTELAEHIAGLSDAEKDRITVATIGNILNPQGLWTRLSFLPTIPFLNITFKPTLPTDIGVNSINYEFQYDPVGGAALYWGNPLTVLNMLAALEFVHGDYLAGGVRAGSLPYGYTPETLADVIDEAIATCDDPGSNCRSYQDATFVLIPQQGTLPLYQPLVDLARATGTSAFVQPIIDLVQPVTKVLIDLGYDYDVNPGIPQTLSLLPFDPFLNPVELAGDLINAGIEGIEAFLDDLDDLDTPAPEQPLAPEEPDELSTLAARPSVVPEQQPAITTLTPRTALASLDEVPERPKTKSGNLFRPGTTTPAESTPSHHGSTDATTTPSISGTTGIAETVTTTSDGDDPATDSAGSTADSASLARPAA